MKRLQISIEPELDIAVGHEAERAGISKAELIRRAIRDSIPPLPPIEEDPLFRMFGTGRSDPDDHRTIDDIVYGPIEHDE